MGGSRWPCKSLKASTLMRNTGSAERGVECVHDTKANTTTRPDVRWAKDRKLVSFMKHVLVDGAVH